MNAADHRAAAERQTLWILIIVSTWMTAWIAWRFASDPRTYIEQRLGINEDLLGVAAWIWIPTLAAIALYAGYTLWAVPVVRAYVLRPNLLGIVAIWAALASGIIEEVVFRHLLMDWLDQHGHGPWTQVIASAALFGAAHALWVLMARDWRIIIPVVSATALLGLALAVLYLAANRSTFPPIAAHILINLIIEPGLILSAILTGMGAKGSWTTTEPEATWTNQTG
jgi:uncharacterized protein